MDHLKNLIDCMSQHRSDVNEVSEAIDELAYSFRGTGNKDVSDKLSRMSAALDQSVSMMGKAVSENLYGSVRDAEQATFNMLATAIGVSSLSDKH